MRTIDLAGKLVFWGLPSVAAFASQSANSAPQAAQRSSPQGPVAVDWRTTPAALPTEPISDSEQATRNERGGLFDDPEGVKPRLDLAEPDPKILHGMSIFHTKIDPLPSSMSAGIVVGTVASFQPYFSNDRTSIYTELQVQIEKVLKDTTGAIGQALAIDELGGAIRLPSGRIAKDMAAPLDSDIEVGKRYVLFLTYSDATKTFSVLKAWELRSGRAQPVAKTDLTREAAQGEVEKYVGMSENDFLYAVQQSLVAAK